MEEGMLHASPLGEPEREADEDKNAVLDRKLRRYFDGRIVRKDLTKSIKEGANVPVYRQTITVRFKRARSTSNALF